MLQNVEKVCSAYQTDGRMMGYSKGELSMEKVKDGKLNRIP